jgi:hypothetical protein
MVRLNHEESVQTERKNSGTETNLAICSTLQRSARPGWGVAYFCSLVAGPAANLVLLV